MAITVSNTGKLVIGTTTGGTLIARGDIILAQTAVSRTSGFYALTLNPGSTLEFDASQATTPGSQTYVCGPSQSLGPNARVFINGSSSARCTVRSNAGGGNGRFSNRGFNTRVGSMRVTYCDFTRIGDASNVAFQPYLSSSTTEPDEFSMANCTFTSGGQISHTSLMASNTIFSLTDCIWTTTASTSCIHTVTNGTVIGATGTRQVKRCAFDKQFGVSSTVQDFSFYQVLFQENFSLSDTYNWAQFEQCIVRKPTAVDNLLPGPTATHCYWLCDFATGNPHFFQVSASRACTINGVILEYTGSGGDGDGIGLANGTPASTLRHTIKYCLVLPRSGDSAQASCTLTTHSANSNQQWASIDHNTFMGGSAADHGVQLNETTATPAGALPLYRSNLYWDTSARGNHFRTVVRSAGACTTDTLTASGATNNCAYTASVAPSGAQTEVTAGYQNSIGTYYNTPTTSGVPGTNDVNVNPGFIDTTRNFANWATTQSQAASVANTITLLRSNLAVNIPGLLLWVRGGFAPTHSSLRVAGHDTASIGASNYSKSTRSTTKLDQMRSAINTRYSVSV
ncbi:MAG: hypothetical protein KBD00_03740 [Candidatus Peribacteraceae bacterium]|nr:hypothetical protein [Candidatus Peribacteraceae bacterium]